MKSVVRSRLYQIFLGSFGNDCQHYYLSLYSVRDIKEPEIRVSLGSTRLKMTLKNVKQLLRILDHKDEKIQKFEAIVNEIAKANEIKHILNSF